MEGQLKLPIEIMNWNYQLKLRIEIMNWNYKLKLQIEITNWNYELKLQIEITNCKPFKFLLLNIYPGQGLEPTQVEINKQFWISLARWG